MNTGPAPAPHVAMLDAIDRKILSILQVDATVPLAEIANRVGRSQTPCWKRIQRLERDGYIRGRVTLVDPALVDLGLTAFVSIQLADHTSEHLSTLRQTIAAMPEIMAAFRLVGDVDYLLRVVVRGPAEFDAFYQRLVSALPARSITSRLALETLKDTSALPLDVPAAPPARP